MRSFSLYSDCRWNGFSKTEELAAVVFCIMHMHSIFHKSNFMSTKLLVVATTKKKKKKKKKTKQKKKKKTNSTATYKNMLLNIYKRVDSGKK